MALRDRIVGNLRDANSLLDGLVNEHAAARRVLEARQQQFDKEYAAAMAQQSEHQALIADSARLTQELEIVEGHLAEAASNETATKSSIATFEGSRVALDQLVQDRRTILQEAADQVAGKSSAMLKARLKRDTLPTSYVASLRDLLERTSIHDAEAKIDDWVRSAIEAEPEKAWRNICDAVLRAYEMKVDAGSSPEPGEELAAHLAKLVFDGRGNLTTNQTNRMYERLNDARVGAIISGTPRDQIVLTYIDEHGKSMKFENASPGQQASALLELLLHQSAGTLVIDQPEDDLDNRVIMRIVEIIRTSKNKRQLIFSTHNPNIVVNGDADKVVVLRSVESPTPTNSPQVEIDVDGAIETRAIRNSITDLMEGGEDAFDLRRRKYRFGLHEAKVA